MIYFKTILIDKLDSAAIETAIRAHSLRRHTPLDLQTATFYTTEKGKFFLGLESKKAIQLVRIKNVLERFFPKVILRFEKNNFTSFRIRLSYLSTFIFVLLLFILGANVFNSFHNGRFESKIFSVLIAIVLFGLLLFFEIKKSIKRVFLAIEN